MGSVLRRLLFFFQRNQFDRDLEDELRFHEEMKAHALADADGMSGDEARAAARRRMGNPLRLREQSREPWIFAAVETLRKAAEQIGRSLVSVALNWLLCHTPADCAILGASRPEQLDQNLIGTWFLAAHMRSANLSSAGQAAFSVVS